MDIEKIELARRLATVLQEYDRSKNDANVFRLESEIRILRSELAKATTKLEDLQIENEWLHSLFAPTPYSSPAAQDNSIECARRRPVNRPKPKNVAKGKSVANGKNVANPGKMKKTPAAKKKQKK